MNVYADSSFILRLVIGEAGSEEAVAAYRQAGRPALPYLWIHQLEVENAIRQRAFHDAQVRPAPERRLIRREMEAAFARLGQLQRRRGLASASIDLEAAVARALKLSADHTQRMGSRAIDVLHVGAALHLQVDRFLTFDRRQSELAQEEGLEVPDLAAERH